MFNLSLVKNFLSAIEKVQMNLYKITRLLYNLLYLSYFPSSCCSRAPSGQLPGIMYPILFALMISPNTRLKPEKYISTVHLFSYSCKRFYSPSPSFLISLAVLSLGEGLLDNVWQFFLRGIMASARLFFNKSKMILESYALPSNTFAS